MSNNFYGEPTPNMGHMHNGIMVYDINHIDQPTHSLLGVEWCVAYLQMCLLYSSIIPTI